MQSKYSKVKENIILAASKVGRRPEEVSLVAVTKNRSLKECMALYDEGQRHFAENRLSELIVKKNNLSQESQWHFIGHLQSNKIGKLVGNTSLIHSVDSVELAERLSEASEKKQLITNVLLQANTSGELSKQGLSPQEWKSVFEKVLNLHGIKVCGLMTMAPLTEDYKIIRACFAGLRNLRDQLQVIAGTRANLHHLSMGMSNDYVIAVEEGATLLRLGSALFD